ncbi:MAG: hypothetical protein G3M78_06415 [Candidatus Nitrohelix vancouverensis]|uniref:Glycosyltransferase RgtA/B/C/D-like domain-containing protein n=1 Tax=Candidatus Nitrohelix vancouverensis TaxID=2705534 RepID=A0A7T0C1X3_9BACT|nr:MAG: hypothetical protein G3M78_06415 [Candidatus Nitrohelix vancouverensis]
MNAILFPILFLSFYLVGRFAASRVGIRFESRSESLAFCPPLGMLLLSQATCLLGFLGLFHPIAFSTLLILALSTGLPRLHKSIASPPSTESNSFRLKSPLEKISIACLSLLALLSLIQALGPAFHTDALVYHLAIPKTYLEAGRFVNLPDNVYSFFPLHFEMLYLLAYGLGGEVLAQLVAWATSLQLVCLIYVYCRAKGAGAWAGFAAAGFLSTPTFFQYSSATYVDLPSALYALAAFFAWELWRERRQNGWALLLCLFASTATATKLTAGMALPLAFLGILLYSAAHKESIGKIFQRIGLLVLSVLFIMSPWWAKNFYYSGNPFAPFLMEWLGGEPGLNWDVARSMLKSEYYAMMGMGTGILDLLLLPYNLSVHAKSSSVQFDGSAGILILLLLPALFALPRKQRPLIFVVCVLVLFWFYNFQFLRFLAPALALFAVASALGLQTISQSIESLRPGLKKTLRLLLPTTLALGLLYNLSLDVQNWRDTQTIAYLTGQEKRSAFLNRHIPQWPAYQSANANFGPEDKIMLAYMRNLGYLLEIPFTSDSFFEAYTLQKILKTHSSVEEISQEMRRRNLDGILFDSRYIFGAGAALSEHEQINFQRFLKTRALPLLEKNRFHLYRFMLN